ncbi:MAG: WD40 repeat domain-containing protein [Thermoplasmata archaeon]|nr:MAG: WD40 repeat domain-containing protein [Thermoplasmata archaeon]
MFLVILTATIASAIVTDNYRMEMKEIGTWNDPGGQGNIDQIDLTSEGDRLALLGYSSPGDLRVTDRELETLAVLEPPHEGAVIEGVRWSVKTRWICAWGSAEEVDHDLFWLWDAETYKLSDQMFDNYTTPLDRLDSAVFVGEDMILALAGRDANGTSRLILIETHSSNIRRDFEWADNTTIVRLGITGSLLLAVDETGTTWTVDSSDWTTLTNMGGHEAAPTADSLATSARFTYIVGYEDGSVAFWYNFPLIHERSAYFGDGPIQGIAWMFMGGTPYYMAVTPGASGGSQVNAYVYNIDSDPATHLSGPMDYPVALTSLATDPMVEGQAWLGFEDGTIRLLNLTIDYNDPPVITIEVPEEGKEYSENFTATGTYYDDWDNVVYINVEVGEYNGTAPVWADGRWSLEINISYLPSGTNTMVVMTGDDFQHTTNQTTFKVVHPPDPDDDDDDDGQAIDMLYVVIAVSVVAVVIIIALLYIRRRPGDERT